VVDVPPPLARRAGGVTPCFFKHWINAVRLAPEAPVGAEADAEVVVELLDELLPHAASARLAVTAPSAGISRRARRRELLEGFMSGPFVVGLLSRRS
jgi:hypothetical protein